MDTETITGNVGPQDRARTVNLRCPRCRRQGAFHAPAGQDVGWDVVEDRSDGRRTIVGHLEIGYRRCPNMECNAFVFVVLSRGSLVRSYPPEVIDFDATNLPQDILASLEEAIKCHAAGCYKACALMVRRTLEELCDDKGAEGRDLKARINALNTVAVIPADLLNAADELRLLGNDAAHIEAKSYDAIGKEEAELAVELAKELLKAVYQYADLVGRLRALRKPAAP